MRIAIYTAIDIGLYFFSVKLLGLDPLVAAFVVLAVSANGIRAKLEAKATPSPSDALGE